jgi:hypothetical protein
MLDIREFKVRSLDLRSSIVSWEVVPTPEDTLDYRFQVLRSEAEGGPWQELSDPFIDHFLFLDNSVQPFHMGRSLFYILRVAHKDGETKDWGPVSLSEEPDLIAKEVRKHWDVVTHELNGRRGWLFPVRTFGTICKNCYDPITQRVTQSQCEQCYGTGFARGFHHPIEVWMQMMPIPKTEQIGGAIVRQENATTALVSHFPSMKNRDLVVVPNHTRWRVAAVEKTERLGSVLHQKVTLTICAPGDVEFRVPVNIADLPAQALAAERNYRYRTTV